MIQHPLITFCIYIFFNRSKTDLSNGCKRWVQCGGNESIIIIRRHGFFLVDLI
ncbi:hypothetical protein PUN28_011844 [Cardiocondyla obscurior]|uniref:Uncharacterized protein n=1 Tax=Cardiocondyla obscurior TaxID=286306 RepID=A0AAW2FH61_9HYME